MMELLNGVPGNAMKATSIPAAAFWALSTILSSEAVCDGAGWPA